MKSDAPAALPPRLSMSDYVTFIEAAFAQKNPRQSLRQKEIEERIEKPFTLTPGDR